MKTSSALANHGNELRDMFEQQEVAEKNAQSEEQDTLLHTFRIVT